MKSRIFEPPIKEPVGGAFVLYVRGCATDRTGTGVVASVECWNSTLRHGDLLPIGADGARRRFARACHEKDADADVSAIDAALLKLAHQLPALLREVAAATEAASAPTDADVRALSDEARPLLEAPDLLERAYQTMCGLGLVGERQTALLAYLAGTARLLEKPVSVIIKGPSSGGKSFTLARALTLFPATAYVDYTSVSPRYLAYSGDDLRHRIVVLYEAGGLSGDTGAYLMRSLLSEGRLHLGTVDKSGDGNAIEARTIQKEGPTALFTTTTRTAIDAELETRALSLGVTDRPEHSRKILARAARAYTGEASEPPDVAPWHALQRWLELAGERRVRIPYAERLASLTPVASIRIRRDFGKLLTLIAASAVLHQRQRERLLDGTIVASIEDYDALRDLMGEAFAAAQQDGLTPAQREAVHAVGTLCDERTARDVGVPLASVAARLGIDKSSAKRRLDNPLRQGYVKNLETRKGGHHPALYVPAEPLPQEATALPEPALLTGGLQEVDL